MTTLRLVLSALSLLMPAFLLAQDLGSWNILNGKVTLDDRWQVFGEAQLRSLRFYDDFHYYEMKGGFNFKVNDQLSFTSGGGRYDTYAAGGNFASPRASREIRSWAQANLKNRAGRFFLEHRYRAEQRFTLNGYRNRFRYRLQASVPINQREMKTGVVYVSVWNEVFLTNTAPYFERNRFFAGLGWEWSDLLAFQLGYVHQFDYRLTDETGRDFLQIGLYFQWERNDPEEVRVPGQVD